MKQKRKNKHGVFIPPHYSISLVKQSSFFKRTLKQGFCFLFLMLCSKFNFAQTGTWNGSTTNTTTPSDLGIGTTGPDGKTEIFIDCPEKNGLVITKDLSCPPLMPDVGGGGTEGGSTVNNVTPTINIPFNFKVGSVTVASMAGPMFTTSVATNPLFWVRTKELTSSLMSSETRFIVTPSSKVGVNVFNPRATLDVRIKVAAKNYPVAIFGLNSTKIGTGAFAEYYTRHIQIVPRCSENGFNQITQDEDLGIFFTDGKAPDGANLSGGLVIAPWSVSSTTNPNGGIRIDNLGNVEIHGNTRATKLTVNAIWWSDFVFAPDYKPMSLPELELFIKANKHLPNIPSEKEVLDSGINIADIQARQLQKIEELTLYAIDQDKKLAEQQVQIELLKARQEELVMKLELLLKK